MANNTYTYDPRKTAFYNSTAWRRLSKAYRTSKFGLCEICHEKGAEVHHKKEIDPAMIDNEQYLQDVALNWDNLQLLCVSCHNSMRSDIARNDLIFKDGRLIKRDTKL